jgi:hypothetical protein
MQTQRNNGNGRKRVKFITLKIRLEVAQRFKNTAINKEMDYSEFLDQLLKSETFDKLFEDPKNRDAVTGFMKHIAKKALENPPTDFGSYRF